MAGLLFTVTIIAPGKMKEKDQKPLQQPPAYDELEPLLFLKLQSAIYDLRFGKTNIPKTMKTTLPPVAAITLIFVFGLQPTALLGQGSLAPPGAPAPTMKTLAQIEPRTPISALPFTITNAGSYYVTTNLTGVSGANGITITASDVTLDLSGFTLTGVSNALDGIHINTGLARVTIRNGVIRDWSGIGCSGVKADQCTGCVFERLRISGSGSWGLVSGERSTVRDCTVVNNPGGGIAMDYHSLAIGCMSAENGGNGFWSPNGATMQDCVAMNNAGDGFGTGAVSAITGCSSRDNAGDGFSFGDGSTLNACAATANGGAGVRAGLNCVVKDCSVKNNGNGGVVATDNCTISGCAVRQNYSPGGIQVQTACLVLGNTCFEHDGGSDMPGIRALGTGNRIEGNNVCSNAWGIMVEGTGNFVFRNTASANFTGNYTNAPGNVVGEILDVSGGGTISNAGPWANFSY